ncbi:MAG: pilus assembly protein TadG-related protein [Candidatus Obscuribacterales bacterium]
MRRKTNRRSRRQDGVIAAVFCCLILIVILSAACLGVDIAHGVHIQSKLQAASDAAALAGVVEIAKHQPSNDDCQRAYNYAVSIAGSNEADNIYIRNDDPDTRVNVSVDIDSNPRTVTVETARRVNFLFANMLRFNHNQPVVSFRPDEILVQGAWASDGTDGNWLSTRSVAAPYLIQSVYPHQIVPMIASLDHVPDSGPAKGQKIASILNSNQAIELVWNSQPAKNVGWVKAWLNDNDSTITIGESWGLQNGVVNSALSRFHAGDVVGMPVTQGGVPMNDSRPILGVITVEVVATGSKSMTVKLHEPIIFHGVKGVPNVTTSTENQAFLQRWQPWTVQLIE